MAKRGTNSFLSTSDALQQDWKDYLDAYVLEPWNTQNHAFPVIKNFDFYSQHNATWNGYANYYDGGFQMNSGNFAVDMFKYNVVPFVSVEYLLQLLSIEIGAFPVLGSWINDIEIQKLIIWNQRALDRIRRELEFFTGVSGIHLPYWNLYEKTYDLSNHVPDMSAIQFLEALKNMFALAFFPRENSLEIIPIQELLNTAIEDWTHLSTPDYSWTPPPIEGYTLQYTRDETDANDVPGQLDPVVFGDGLLDLSVNADVPFEDGHIDINIPPRFWVTPEVIQEGSSNEVIGLKETNLRFLLYQGMQEDANNDDYPMASNFNEDTNGVNIGAKTLRWDGPDGLFEQYWSKYAKLLDEGKPVKKELRLTINDLLKIKEYKFPRKKIYHDQGEMVGVVSKVTMRVDTKQLLTSLVEFYGE